MNVHPMSEMNGAVQLQPTQNTKMQQSDVPIQVDVAAKAQTKPATSSDMSSAVHFVKQKIADSSLQVVFDTDTKAGRSWLNVVDKATGEIVYEIPSENVRRVMENNGGLTGLHIDLKS